LEESFQKLRIETAYGLMILLWIKVVNSIPNLSLQLKITLNATKEWLLLNLPKYFFFALIYPHSFK